MHAHLRIGAVWLLSAIASAQEPPPRIDAFFWHNSPNDRGALDGIREALTAAGFACTIREHQAGGDDTRAAAILQEIKAGDGALVLALGTQAALLAKAALRERPIVFAAVSNPVASGVLPGWDNGHANLCGASNWIPPSNVMKVFRMAVPGLERLGVLRTNRSGVVSAAELATMREYVAAPGSPRVELIEAVADDHRGLGEAVQRLLAAKIQALWIPIDLEVYQHLDAVRAALPAEGVPMLSTALPAARQGAAVAVIVDYVMLGRAATAQVLAILQQRREPAAIPTATLNGYQVVVNLGAARRSRTELPLSLLLLADQLIGEDDHGR